MKTILITLGIAALILTVPMLFGAIWAFIELEDEERTWREFEEEDRCQENATNTKSQSKNS